ncbi:acyl transferase/acyl hydrolase/lysophospholipase [Hypoxylon cercidicola]|nr:acyl transferase/acyl hydrolase/lysophospholipase [Hypoxylon cercidicola]
MAPVVKILSLDGGGIRGISSLLILQGLMETIQRARNLDTVPRPCEYFDLIGGTSTGGIIAIMLGRLGMTVEDCIKAYRRLAQKAFTPKRRVLPLPLPPTGAYSATALKMAIRDVVQANCREADCVAKGACPHGDQLFRDDSCVKTVVLAVTKENVDARPTLFKTYDTTSGFRDCTIWEVARATSAASTFFKPIRCGRDQIEFIDAAFGYNNPCEALIEEAQRQFPKGSHMNILSVGTGLGAVVTIKNTRLSILKTLKSIATSSKKVADRLNDEYGDMGQYYRFNVDRGLEDVTIADWSKDSQISAHTHNYLLEKRRDIERYVEFLLLADVGTDRATNNQQPLLPFFSRNRGDITEETNGRILMFQNMALWGSEQHNSIISL